MLQSMGEDKGRQYMEALSKQINSRAHRSSLMNQLMMAGEFPLLISQYRRAWKIKKTGPPIDWCRSIHGSSIDRIAVTAKTLIRGGATLCRFHLSEEGQTFMRQLSRIPARRTSCPIRRD